MLNPSSLFRKNTYSAYIFDQDGTIYWGDLLPGAAETVAALRAAGKQVLGL